MVSAFPHYYIYSCGNAETMNTLEKSYVMNIVSSLQYSVFYSQKRLFPLLFCNRLHDLNKNKWFYMLSY